MTDKRSFHGLLHRATHRIPGVPEHAVRPAGHQGTRQRGGQPHPEHLAAPGRAHRRGVAFHPGLGHGWNHSPARPPRFMPAWQRRIAAFFARER